MESRVNTLPRRNFSKLRGRQSHVQDPSYRNLPPLTTLAHPPDLKEIQVQDPILMGDINVDLDEAQNPCSQLISDILTEFGLINLMRHFWKRRHFRQLKTWTQVRQGTVLRERCYDIICTNCHIFGIAVIRYMMNYSSYHFALRVCFLQRPTKCHSLYLRVIRLFAFSLPDAAYLIVADSKFQDIKCLETPPTPLTCLLRPLWMSSVTINIIDECAALRSNPRHLWNVARALTKYVRKSLI